MTSPGASRPIDVTDHLPGDLGGPLPFVAARVHSFQEVIIDGGPSRTCFTFETDTEPGRAIGRLMVAESRASLSERITDAINRRAIVVVWGTVMRDRHPGGERWLTGWVDILEAP